MKPLKCNTNQSAFPLFQNQSMMKWWYSWQLGIIHQNIIFSSPHDPLNNIVYSHLFLPLLNPRLYVSWCGCVPGSSRGGSQDQSGHATSFIPESTTGAGDTGGNHRSRRLDLNQRRVDEFTRLPIITSYLQHHFLTLSLDFEKKNCSSGFENKNQLFN